VSDKFTSGGKGASLSGLRVSPQTGIAQRQSSLGNLLGKIFGH
jgi:hypothetical protein